MADVKITQFDDAGTLDGTEKIYLVRGTTDYNTTPNAIVAAEASARALGDTAQSFAAVVLTNPFTAGKAPRRIGDVAINTTLGEIWQATAIINVPASWNRISAGYYNGQIIFESTEVKESILPNVLNKWGNIESLTINSFQGAQEGYVNEYMLEFTVSEDDFTLTLPEGVRWIEEPTWENGYTYQVSIVNNLAVFAGWEA